jgi:hypothetical protein
VISVIFADVQRVRSAYQLTPACQKGRAASVICSLNSRISPPAAAQDCSHADPAGTIVRSAQRITDNMSSEDFMEFDALSGKRFRVGKVLLPKT